MRFCRRRCMAIATATGGMDCKTCVDLFIVYQLAVKLYAKSIRNLSGWAGDDLRLACEQAERLWLECRDANDALTAHWRQNHCPDCFAFFGEMRWAVNKSKSITEQAGILIHASKPSEHADAWSQLREHWKDAHQEWVLAAQNLKSHFAQHSNEDS